MSKNDTEIRNSKGERVFLYDRHMPETDALEYLTLKGHLLVEEMLVRLAQLTLPHPKYLKLLKLGFYTRTCIVRAAVRGKSEDAHWKLILTLNQIRNDYAHELVPPRVADKLKELFRLDDEIYPDKGNANSMGDAERLRHAIQHCMEFLLSIDPPKPGQ